MSIRLLLLLLLLLWLVSVALSSQVDLLLLLLLRLHLIRRVLLRLQLLGVGRIRETSREREASVVRLVARLGHVLLLLLLLGRWRLELAVNRVVADGVGVGVTTLKCWLRRMRSIAAADDIWLGSAQRALKGWQRAKRVPSRAKRSGARQTGIRTSTKAVGNAAVLDRVTRVIRERELGDTIGRRVGPGLALAAAWTSDGAG